MTRRALALARELVELTAKYSDAEFEIALELIGDGQLFFKMREATSVARKRGSSARITGDLRKDTGSQIVSAKIGSIEDLLASLKSVDQLFAQELIERLEGAKSLSTVRKLRDFQSEIGAPRSPSSSRRIDVVIEITMFGLSGEANQRKALLDRLEISSADQSSLRSWSNLIVKPESH